MTVNEQIDELLTTAERWIKNAEDARELRFDAREVQASLVFADINIRKVKKLIAKAEHAESNP